MEKKDVYLSAALKFATIQYEQKRTEMKQCTPQPAINDLRPIVPYQVHNQVDFGKSVINGRGLIYLAISKMGFILKHLQEFKVAYQ